LTSDIETTASGVLVLLLSSITVGGAHVGSTECPLTISGMPHVINDACTAGTQLSVLHFRHSGPVFLYSPRPIRISEPSRVFRECARFAIGEMYTPDLAERARRAARAQEVRIIEPGGAYTTELSPKRLNIEVDRVGIVRDLSCG
jgi:hypothetical protein